MPGKHVQLLHSTNIFHVSSPVLPCPAERPDVRYSLVAVDFLPPSVVDGMLRTLACQLASGALRPLNHISHSLSNVAAAFRQMIQASLVPCHALSTHGLCGRWVEYRVQRPLAPSAA